MIHIKSQNVLNEPQIISYSDSQHAVYALNKSSLLYQGLQLWCRLYNQKSDKLINLVRKDDNYVYFKALAPLSEQTFSRNFLHNYRGTNDIGYATPKFMKYLNKRYKALYTRDMFNVVDNVTPNMICPHAHSNHYYANLRTDAMLKNIKKGTLHINYDYDPFASSDLPSTQNFNEHDKILRSLIHHVYKLPFEQVSKHSVLYQMVLLWTTLHQHSLSQVVKGFEQDNNYIYFGMTNIPRKHMWKFKHPNRYSDVDYFLLGGDGDGETVKKFINWLRTSTTAKVEHQLANQSKLHISKD